jgi:putative modified peptide
MGSAAQACEDLLARLFTDAEFRARFRQDPQRVGRELGIDEAAVAALAQSDWVGLELAAGSYSHKREAYAGRKRRWWSIR